MTPGSASSPALTAIERLIDAFVANDTGAAADALDPHVTWHHNIGEGSPLEGTYHGSGAVAKLWEDILEAWEVLRFEEVELGETPGGVVHQGKVRLRARESDVELAVPERIEIRVEDGRIIEVRFNAATGGR